MRYTNALVMLIFVLAAWMKVIAQDSDTEEAWSKHKIDMSEKWGVEILGVRITAAGYMLDFRYRVTDQEKAAPIFQRKNKPVLIDRETKQKFFVASSPTVGPMRSSNTPEAGRTYFMLFGNPGGFIRPGGKVAVEVGPFRVDDLVVQ